MRRPTTTVDLSPAQARRIALRAQHFGRPAPSRTPDLGHMRRLVRALGAVQIDAVNVLVRSHYLPLFARLGPYPRELLDTLAYRRRHAFEYLGHAASYLPVELQPALRFRMRGNAEAGQWAALQDRLARERPGYVDAVRQEVRERGPLAFTDLTDPARRDKVPTRYADSTLLWHRWSDGKSVLEGLFLTGELAVADRRGFERRYDLPERVIPAEVLARPTPSREESRRILARHAMSALGVATVKDAADYFRMRVATARDALRSLAEEGAVVPARVDGWPAPTYLDPRWRGAAADTPVAARALLSPFDSLIWERARTQRLFDFQVSFELYVPEAKRRYGYYVLPFLLGEELVARVDLKADQERSALLVRGAYLEPGRPVGPVAAELAAELRGLADWLSLATIEVADRGDLAGPLRHALR